MQLLWKTSDHPQPPFSSSRNERQIPNKKIRFASSKMPRVQLSFHPALVTPKAHREESMRAESDGRARTGESKEQGCISPLSF